MNTRTKPRKKPAKTATMRINQENFPSPKPDKKDITIAELMRKYEIMARDLGYAESRIDMLSRRVEDRDEAAMVGATPTPPPDYFGSVLGDIYQMFQKRNIPYASPTEQFANFFLSGPVVRGKLTPIEYALTLVAKQDDAAWAAINRGEIGEDFEERIMDGAVYRIIILCLMRKGREDKK